MEQDDMRTSSGEPPWTTRPVCCLRAGVPATLLCAVSVRAAGVGRLDPRSVVPGSGMAAVQQGRGCNWRTALRAAKRRRTTLRAAKGGDAIGEQQDLELGSAAREAVIQPYQHPRHTTAKPKRRECRSSGRGAEDKAAGVGCRRRMRAWRRRHDR